MDFNEESTDPFSSSETGGWNYNPLFDNNNIVDENHHMQLPFRNKHGGVNNCDSKRTELALGEYETESGYSESLSFLSDILSAENFFDNSFDSSSLDNFSTFSDIEEELERIAELADGMRGKGRLSISSGHDRESVVSPANSSQIVSSKGTIRGVKNRVRDNIFHFLSEQNQQQRKKEEEEQDEEPVDPDQGKVILYTTSLGLIRRTQGDCDYVRKIFHNLMVNVDERNVFMNPRLKKELEERLGGKVMTLPKVFINGELIGGAEEVENLVETGKMKDIVASLEHVSSSKPCPGCGGYRFVTCNKCSGSGSSIRTRFTREISNLRCSACTNGMIPCPDCNHHPVQTSDKRLPNANSH